MDIAKIQEKITKKESELSELKQQLEVEKSKVDFIVINGWAYEIKDHDFNKKLSDIKIPAGKELWHPSECFNLYDDKKLREQLNLSDCWFFVKQVRENTTDVARFYADSVWVNVDSSYGSDYRDSDLGVRFKWRVKDEN